MFLLLVCFVICGVNGATQRDCAESISDIRVGPKNILPLIVNGTNPPTFYYPDEKGTLRVPFNRSITLACPGEGNFLLNVTRLPWIADALCVSGNRFKVKNQVFKFSDLRCKYHPQNEMRRIGHCSWGFLRLVAGFDLLDKGFLKTMEVCFDEETYRPVYSQYRLSKNIAGKQSGQARPYWSGWKFYPGHNLKFLYQRETQFETLKNTLKSEELAEKYFDYDNGYFLARGHLTANGDFMYASQQMATFWYPNTMPQWQIFNSGNWLKLEMNVRDFAAKRSLDLDVYTGVFGQTALPGAKNDSRPLYLNFDGEDKDFAVPKFYWKIIYDPVSHRGTAFVGLNEPHAREIEKHMYLCDDISSEGDFSWLSWNSKNLSAGFSYVCDIEDLQKSVPAIPKFSLSGILS